MKSFLWTSLVLVTLLAFNLWISHSDYAKVFYKDTIGTFLEYDVKGFYIFWAVIFVANFIKLLSNRQKSKYKELERVFKSKIEMLVIANEKLFSYRLRDTLLHVFKEYIKKQPYVIGVQLYEYHQKFENQKSNIHLKFIDGYAAENTSVNAVLQTHFSMNIDLYREFIKAYDACFEPIEKDILESLEYPPEQTDIYDIKPLIDFIKKHNDALTKKRKFVYEDAMAYTLVILAIRILERSTGSSISFALKDSAKKSLESLVKRTGYLQAALAHFPVTFSYTGSTAKANRQYIASKVRINETNYMYMIILDPSVVLDENRMEILNEVTSDFESLLAKTLGRVYNEDNNTEGDDYHGGN